MLTFTERRVIEKFLEKSEKSTLGRGHELVSSILFATGGALIVSACLLTLNNLNAESMKLVFFPGIASGMAILLGGAYGLYQSKRIKVRSELASAIQHLMN